MENGWLKAHSDTLMDQIMNKTCPNCHSAGTVTALLSLAQGRIHRQDVTLTRSGNFSRRYLFCYKIVKRQKGEFRCVTG